MGITISDIMLCIAFFYEQEKGQKNSTATVETQYSSKDAAKALKIGRISFDETLSILKQHEDNVKLTTTALYYIWELSTKETFSSDTAASDTVKRIEGVVKAMKRHPLKADIQGAGCGALLSFSAAASSHLGLLGNSTGTVIDAVVRAMRHHPKDIDLQARGCGALMNLAANALLVAVIGSSGAIDVIVDSMRSHPKRESIQNRACGALQNLASISGNRPIIYEVGGVEQVVIALKRFKSTELCLHAIGALRNFTSHEDSLVQLKELNVRALILSMKKKMPAVSGDGSTNYLLDKLE